MPEGAFAQRRIGGGELLECKSRGDAERGRTSAQAIRKYLNKISGPMLDRIDIHVEVPAVKHET